MSIFSRSTLVPQGETIDLTATATASSSSVLPSGHPPQLIDLTLPDPVSVSPRDHMHAVVALLRPRSIDLTQDTSGGRRRGRSVRNSSSPHWEGHSPLSQISNIEAEQPYEIIDTGSLERPHQRTAKEQSMSSISLAWNPIRRSETSVADQQHARKSRNSPFEAFPFLDFPPEIRNCVYKMLLTTPKIPIEFPEPTGCNRALRAAKWEKCTTWKMRRRHKTLFLEILEVSKQLHAEASGILYGCNVFKYRSDYGMYTQQSHNPTGAHLSQTSNHRERTPASDITNSSFTTTQAHQAIDHVWKPSYWAGSVGGRPCETVREGRFEAGDFRNDLVWLEAVPS